MCIYIWTGIKQFLDGFGNPLENLHYNTSYVIMLY